MIKSNILQTLDDKLNTISSTKLVYESISNETEKQLEELDEHERKIKKLLLKNILILENENKTLAEKNKKNKTVLIVLKTYLKDVMFDANNWEINYKKLMLENKYLLTKLESIKQIRRNNDADSLKELPREKRKITKENTHTKHLSSKSCFIN